MTFFQVLIFPLTRQTNVLHHIRKILHVKKTITKMIKMIKKKHEKKNSTNSKIKDVILII